jgi:hypothetical protein
MSAMQVEMERKDCMMKQIGKRMMGATGADDDGEVAAMASQKISPAGRLTHQKSRNSPHNDFAEPLPVTTASKKAKQQVAAAATIARVPISEPDIDFDNILPAKTVHQADEGCFAVPAPSSRHQSGAVRG